MIEGTKFSKSVTAVGPNLWAWQPSRGGGVAAQVAAFCAHSCQPTTCASGAAHMQARWRAMH